MPTVIKDGNENEMFDERDEVAIVAPAFLVN
jgi:hypothetical protein